VGVVDRPRAGRGSGRGIRRHARGRARLDGVMSASPVRSSAPSLLDPGESRWRGLRAPWRRGAWTPEEVAVALHARRAELLRELRTLPMAHGIPARVLDEVIDDAVCAVVMKPRAIRDEEHLRRSFWLSVKLLLARYREGRHRVRLGSRERAEFDPAAASVAAPGRAVDETVELIDRVAIAADFMAQLDELEARVTAVMAIEGVGIKRAARELGLPLGTVKAASERAQTKLQQVATIAAAGRMCGYRHGAIVAHAAGMARMQEARAARAHIAACAGCRRSYVLLLRELRSREFLRGASAVFAPVPLLPVAEHPGLVDRVAAFAGARLPGNGMSGGGAAGGARERAVMVLGGSAGAAKTAGVFAGATLLVLSATAGIRDLHGVGPHRRIHHTDVPRRVAPVQETVRTSVAPAAPQAIHPAIPAPARLTRAAQTVSHPSSGGGFAYLGGDASSAHPSSAAVDPDPAPVAEAATAAADTDPAATARETTNGQAASMRYLGGGP
jgi:DNA-directed RNA polymerase specialized sigma24 family protein